MTETEKIAGKKILIVDDDPFLLGISAAKFKEAGFIVQTAPDGLEAWKFVNGGYAPDIVFTGILMPHMSGFDLIRKMQASPQLAPIPVVISSHRGRPEDMVTAKELQVDDFIIQGTVPLVEIVRRVNLVLGIRQKYRIKLEQSVYDGEELMVFMNQAQHTMHGRNPNKELYLELIPEKEEGVYRVTLEEGRPT